MNIAILDDEFDTVRTLECYPQLAAHKVTIWRDHSKDTAVLAERLKDAEAIVMLRERTPIRADLIARLPKLKMLTLNGPYPHVDLDACTARGIVLCAGKPRPWSATAELTWGLIICAMRQIPQQMASLKRGQWQTALGRGLRGRTIHTLEAPLLDQGARGDDQDAPGVGAQEQLANEQARHDGLAGPWVISEEKAQRLALKHLLVDGSYLVWEWLNS